MTGRWPSHCLPLAALLLLVACTSKKDQPAGTEGGGLRASDLPQVRVSDDSTHLLFTYLVADGSFRTVDKISAVPEEARSQVVVIDTRLTPEQRRSGRLIFVADLTSKREDGTYPCRPVSRFKFERDLLRHPGEAAALPPECQDLPPTPKDRVVLYSTSWCGVCAAAKEFLAKNKIPFLEKDVEADPRAQLELTCKALASGTRVNGVPVLDIGGKLLLGFDGPEILRLARALNRAEH